MILGVDAGNDAVKVCGQFGVMSFSSTLGEWRERNLTNSYVGDEMEWEYGGRKGFAGALATAESDWSNSRKGITKAHEDAKMRVLLALHRYGGSDEYNIIVGQPIDTHNVDHKQAIKQMLIGSHTMRVNGITRTFTIKRVEVAPEGATAALSCPLEGVQRVIDLGSGTTNFATVVGIRNEQGKLIIRNIDLDSWTVARGMGNTKSKNLADIARGIVNEAWQRWEVSDTYRLAGGGAMPMLSFLKEHLPNVDVIRPSISMYHNTHKQLPLPVYANAVAFYELGKRIYG